MSTLYGPNNRPLSGGQVNKLQLEIARLNHELGDYRRFKKEMYGILNVLIQRAPEKEILITREELTCVAQSLLPINFDLCVTNDDKQVLRLTLQLPPESRCTSNND